MNTTATVLCIAAVFIMAALMVWAVRAATPEGPPTIKIPMYQVPVGTTVAVPVEFQSYQHNINAIIFAVKYDHEALHFENYVSHLPNDLAAVSVDTSMPGRVGVAVINPSYPDVIPDGFLVSIRFTRPKGSVGSEITYHTEPQPSFGNVDGHSVPGIWLNGAVGDLYSLGLHKTRVILPLVSK